MVSLETATSSHRFGGNTGTKPLDSGRALVQQTQIKIPGRPSFTHLPLRSLAFHWPKWRNSSITVPAAGEMLNSASPFNCTVVWSHPSNRYTAMPPPCPLQRTSIAPRPTFGKKPAAAVPNALSSSPWNLGDGPHKGERTTVEPSAKIASDNEQCQQCTFWLENVLRATTACNFSSRIWPDGSAPAALASLLFDPPEPQIIRKTQRIATFLPFRSSPSSFFLLFLFYSSLFWSFSSLCFCPALLFICPYCRKFNF